MLKPRVQTADASRVSVHTTAERRMTGRRLQARRLRIWQLDPHCADCRRVVAYPDGFELDHKVPLYLGGQDTDENCQVMCPDCHRAKTARDLKGEGASKVWKADRPETAPGPTYRKFPGSR